MGQQTCFEQLVDKLFQRQILNMASSEGAGMNPDIKLRVLELYSGIGGMHFALAESGLNFEVAAAVDINNVANDIYRHNFPGVKLMQRSIESLSLSELDKLRVDLVTMSPPCQPFTRVGKQRDNADPRTKSFFHFLHLLEQTDRKPTYILLENVKGFDESLTRQALKETLSKCDYHVQEIVAQLKKTPSNLVVMTLKRVTRELLLTPLQFGIPNSRLRFFLLATRCPDQLPFKLTNEIEHELPECAEPYLVHKLRSEIGVHSEEPVSKKPKNNTEHCDSEDMSSSTKSNLENSSVNQPKLSSPAVNVDSESGVSKVEETVDDTPCDNPVSKATAQDCDGSELCPPDVASAQSPGATSGRKSPAAYVKYASICRPLRKYLENENEDYFHEYMIPEKFLPRFWVMDIVHPHSTNTCCFTKRYGHHIEGAGSVLQTHQDSHADLAAYKLDRLYSFEVEAGVRSMGLRFFTPREIANIMSFPPEFCFPAGCSTIQCYRVLGNSLNVHCVAVLLRLLCGNK